VNGRSEVRSENPDCNQYKEKGPCLAYIARWAYSTITGQCEMFIYGGCLGNKNNFRSKEECEKACINGTTIGKAMLVGEIAYVL